MAKIWNNRYRIQIQNSRFTVSLWQILAAGRLIGAIIMSPLFPRRQFANYTYPCL